MNAMMNYVSEPVEGVPTPHLTDIDINLSGPKRVTSSLGKKPLACVSEKPLFSISDVSLQMSSGKFGLSLKVNLRCSTIPSDHRKMMENKLKEMADQMTAMFEHTVTSAHNGSFFAGFDSDVTIFKDNKIVKPDELFNLVGTTSFLGDLVLVMSHASIKDEEKESWPIKFVVKTLSVHKASAKDKLCTLMLPSKPAIASTVPALEHFSEEDSVPETSDDEQ